MRGARDRPGAGRQELLECVREGKDGKRSIRKNKPSRCLTLRQAASPVWILPAAFRTIQTTESCVSSLVTQAQQGWCETLPYSSMSLHCSFYSGFQQEAQLETWLLSKEVPFPCSCGPSGTVYPNLWAALAWSQPYPSFPCLAELDSILLPSGWKDWLLISLQLLPAANTTSFVLSHV